MVNLVPRWMRELDRWMDLRTQICLYGNINDAIHYPSGKGAEEVWALGSLSSAVVDCLRNQEMPYEIIGIFDIIDGMVFADAHEQGSMAERYAQVISRAPADGPSGDRQAPGPARPEDLVELAIQQMRLCMSDRSCACAFILSNASQLCSNADSLQHAEQNAFLRLLKASHESQRVLVERDGQRALVQNLMVLLCNKLSDLPPWLYLGNPFFTSIEVNLPRSHERRHFLQTHVMGGGAPEGMGEVDPDELVDLTEGMTFRDLSGIRAIARKVAPSALNAKSLVDYYKYGQRESLWDNLDWERLANAEETLSQRVMGQPAAVQAVADVLRRARLHLSGAQHSSRTKPRGILFFAGPTGVGKTEMAKAVAELVFGAEEACIRFDMSEFSQSHSDQRLLGAPPGYVGYEEGGQLTNQVRSNPFSVILFDEIEKAHPSILDKFLQILEDGRMTDGRGETVYFSECIIVFTSNIGVYRLDASTGRPIVSPHDGRPIPVVDSSTDPSYAEVQSKILDGVRSYFKYVLGRPELLNRIGQNVVIFDFIRPDIMKRILEQKVLPSIQSQVRDKWGLEVSFADRTVEQLLEQVTQDLSSGGRGIGNHVEVALLNPLARVLYQLCSDGTRLDGRTLVVTELETSEDAVNGCQGIHHELH